MFKPIWPWLFGVVPVCLGFYVAKRNWKWGGDQAEFWLLLTLGILVTGALTTAAAGIGWGVSSFIAGKSDKVWHQCWTGNMVSLRSADGTHGAVYGSLFMLSGFIDSRQVYYYYTVNQDGSFAPRRWYTNSYTAIYEEERTDGKIVQFDVKFKHEWVGWMAAPDDDLRMDFHIPKGSLKQSFSVQ